jgi:hypothetical protein
MGRTPDGTPPCTGADVLEIIGLLRSAGVDVWVDGGWGIERHGPDGLAYETGGFCGVGTIDGHQVTCMSAEFQVRSHIGYDVDENDWHDVRHLHERFGLPIPEDYEPWTS